MNVYVASSWKNENRITAVVNLLEKNLYRVYDFRRNDAFKWSQVDANWETWDSRTFMAALRHARARVGFRADMAALQLCDVCVLLLSCGRSAHLEAGWCKGAGKRVIVCLSRSETAPAELMYLMADAVVDNLDSLLFEINKMRAAYGEVTNENGV